jgi:superfamily II DNA or RNA helicase
VHVVEGGEKSIAAEVEGGDVYDVEIRHVGDTLRVWCSCPYFADRATGCKHLWATAVLAVERDWLTRLPGDLRVLMDFADAEDLPFGVLDEPERMATSSVPLRRPDWAITLAAVTPTVADGSAADASDSELIYVLSGPPRATVTELPLVVERRTRRRDGAWSRPQPARLTVDTIAHLPDPDDRWALSFISREAAFGVASISGPLLEVLLPRLCPTGRVRLRQGYANVPSISDADEESPLTWDDGAPWRLVLVVTHEQDDGRDEYRVSAVLVRGHERVNIQQFAVITTTIAVRENVASRFDPAGGFAWAMQLRARGIVTIPAQGRRSLIESLARSAVQHVELPEELRWEQRVAIPRFSVIVHKPDDWSRDSVLEIAADYDGTTTPLDRSASLLSADGRVMYLRDSARERDALQTLRRLGVKDHDGYGRRELTITYRRVPALVHALLDAGWLVQAEGIRYRTLSAPRLRVKSGIDWFDIETLGDADTPVDVPELVKALAKGRRTVTLGDGTIGMLPEEWLARVAPLLAIGEAHQTSVRFKPSQAALIDALLAAQPEVDWDEGFDRARDALRHFEGVHPEDAPSTFRGELREYQREALGWMRFLREFGFGGCLADDMGLGKTVMVLAMLEGRRTDSAGPHGPSLVVVPRSLVFNWMNEAARFTPALRVLDFAHAERHDARDAIAFADLVLTTYGTLRRDVAALQEHLFDYVVLDEAQAIKNAATATSKSVRLLRAQHRLALTGTPVENHLGELHSLFDFLNPGLLGARGASGARGAIGAGTSDETLKLFARGLRPFFLRRTKEQVTPELPARTEETLYCELEGEQQRLYEQLREHYRRTLLKQIEREGFARSKFQILEALLRLRQAACHTALLPATDSGQSAKFDLLLPRLNEVIGEGRKALVFSQFTSLLGLLRPHLDADRISYEYLDGQTRDRDERVARFQNDPACPLFLISLKAGGVGLNLTAAEYVFLLDPWWNPAVEMQAIDRTHRIGQEKPVFAYRLVARDTVEERILELQAQKRALADAILEAGSGGLRGLQREDLERLLA